MHLTVVAENKSIAKVYSVKVDNAQKLLSKDCFLLTLIEVFGFLDCTFQA